MFDTKTMTLIKSIDVGSARPDGIYFDSFNKRVYVFGHPTKDATVIEAKDGTVLGTIDLGGTPEQGVGDGTGMLYVVMQDAVGSVTAVDVKIMKVVGHYSFVDKGGCNGLALDCKEPDPLCSMRPVGQSAHPAADDGDPEREGRQDPRQSSAGGKFRRSSIQPHNHGGLQYPRQRHYDDREREESDEL
jgi:hypothetical protein